MNSFQSYKVEDVAGIAAFIAVVAGTAVGQCKLPTAGNVAGFLGFTGDSGTVGQSVPVVRGRCRAVAAGVITHGHWVRIADSTGKVEDCQTLVDSAPGSAANCNVIGKAEGDTTTSGDSLFVTTQEFVAKTAVS